MVKNPSKASYYLKYLKFRALKAQNFKLDPSWLLIKTTERPKRAKTLGSNMDDLIAQYFDAAVGF